MKKQLTEDQKKRIKEALNESSLLNEAFKDPLMNKVHTLLASDYKKRSKYQDMIAPNVIWSGLYAMGYKADTSTAIKLMPNQVQPHMKSNPDDVVLIFRNLNGSDVPVLLAIMQNNKHVRISGRIYTINNYGANSKDPKDIRNSHDKKPDVYTRTGGNAKDDKTGFSSRETITRSELFGSDTFAYAIKKNTTGTYSGNNYGKSKKDYSSNYEKIKEAQKILADKLRDLKASRRSGLSDGLIGSQNAIIRIAQKIKDFTDMILANPDKFRYTDIDDIERNDYDRNDYRVFTTSVLKLYVDAVDKQKDAETTYLSGNNPDYELKSVTTYLAKIEKVINAATKK